MKKLIVIIVILFVNCKEKNIKQDAPIIEKKQDLPKKEFIFDISYKTNEAHNIKIMMNDIVRDEFQKSNIHIFESVVPTASYDNVIAQFGEDNMSNNIFLNLGTKTPAELEVSQIKLSYGKKQIIILPNDIENNFTFNKYVRYDSISKRLITFKKQNSFNPTLILRRKVINKLLKD